MKKIILVFAVLSLLSGVVKAAGVRVGCECFSCWNEEGPPYNVTISYDNDVRDFEDDLIPVRAFALDITLDNDAFITGYSDPNPHYNIYPGSIILDMDGNIIDPGTPVADPSYPGTLGGIGTNGVTIEMGSSYVTGEDTPPYQGQLITLEVSGPCRMTITQNVIRGGIVMENPEIDSDPAFEGCYVPEPGSLLLFGMGGLVLIRRKIL
jgi:hypothetical protein